jgi:hypothetical protein
MVSVTTKFLKRAPGMILVPVLVVGTLALALYLLGIVPGHLQSTPGEVEEYDNLEEAESDLGFGIVVPSYFPSYLSWPPVNIQGQLEPVPMAKMLFLSSDHLTEALLICQVVSASEDLPIALPWIKAALSEAPVLISGNAGTLITGRRADGALINGVYWRADGMHFIVMTIHPAKELMILATSMHP